MEAALTEDDYWVVKNESTAEIKVKGSRFIARVLPAASRDRAETQYADISKQNYKATHNCMAYRIDADTFRYSDDGEPSGTAGPPILQVIDGAGLLETLCVVTRYFGGTKLGTGGLIRAYAEAARLAVEKAVVQKKTRMRRVTLRLSYEWETPLRRLIERFNGRLTDSRYDDAITMDIAVPQSRHDAFLQAVTETTQSQVKPISG